MYFADEVYWIPYRLKFGDSKTSAPFPSCIVLFRNLNKKKGVKTFTWEYKRLEAKRRRENDTTK